METKIVDGDLFNTECQVIAHQVNCIGVMGSGVAKEVKRLYPNAFKEYCSLVSSMDHQVLGGCLLVDCGDKYIASLFGQYSYRGDNTYTSGYVLPALNPGVNDSYYNESTPVRYTNYEGFYMSLTRLRTDMNKLGLKSVAFPYKIGSDRGGADWNVILSMINSVFSESDKEVIIYRLS